MKQRRGQALVEVLVGLFVLVTGFLGILTLLAQSFYLNRTITDQTTGAYLAAEGIELAKSLIDHDVYTHLAGIGTGWGTCFGGGNKDYEIDYTISDCTTMRPFSSNDYLEYNPVSHAYLYSYNDLLGGGTQTTFTRRIRTQASGANQITVTATVFWNGGNGTTQSVALEDVFYDWHP
jgi:hypothetical protein